MKIERVQKILAVVGIAVALLIYPCTMLMSMQYEERQTEEIKYDMTKGSLYHIKDKDIIQQTLTPKAVPDEIMFYMANGASRTGKGKILFTFSQNGVEKATKDVEAQVIEDWCYRSFSFKKGTFSEGNIDVTIHTDQLSKDATVHLCMMKVKGGQTVHANAHDKGKTLCTYMRYEKDNSVQGKFNLITIAMLLFVIIGAVCYVRMFRKKKKLHVLLAVLLVVEFLFITFFANVREVLSQHSNTLCAGVIGVCVLIGIALAGMVYIVARKKEMAYDKLFLFLVITWGLVFMVALPPYSTPDEKNHINTAYQLSNQMLGVETFGGEKKLLVREGDFDDTLNEFPKCVNYQSMFQACRTIFTDKTEATKEIPAGIFGANKMEHFPMALGMTVGRLLHLSFVPMIFLARLFAFAVFVTLGYFAMKLIPFRKCLFMVISLLPMVLHLASSCSYDSTLNGIIFLYIAYLFHLIYKKERIERKDEVLLGIILFALTPYKYVYSVMGLGLFALPKEKFAGKHEKKFLVLGCFAAMFVSFIIFYSTRIIQKAKETGLDYTEEKGFTVSYLLHNLYRAVSVFASTFCKKGIFYLETMVGGKLGWLEIELSPYLIYSYVALLAGATVIEEKENPLDKLRLTMKPQRRWIIGICLLIALAALGSMWLAWTPLSFTAIEGVQGRYFLPILFPLCCIVSVKHFKLKVNPKWLILAMCILNTGAILEVMKTILSR